LLEVTHHNRDLLRDWIRNLCKNNQITKVYLGLTAWYRDLQVCDPEKADQFDKLVEETNVRLRDFGLEMETLRMPQEREGQWEAIAVGYAATRNGLPPTDLLIGSGGGSVQISAISSNHVDFSGVQKGFRKDMDRLMKDGIGVFESISDAWKTEMANFAVKNPSFVVKENSNVIAISSSFYAAEAVGYAECQPIKSCDAIARFAEFRDFIVTKYSNLDESARPNKAEAMNIVNMTMQIELLNGLVHRESTVRFCRNWRINGNLFRTTWTMGWFIERMESEDD